MVKKTIKYVDYNGNERVEDCYFNLSKAEVTELENSVTGGLTSIFEKASKTQDVPTVIKLFKEIILASYGEKSADGRRFQKYDDEGHRLVNKFVDTEAYSELFVDLIQHPESTAEFFNNLVTQKNVATELKVVKSNNE